MGYMELDKRHMQTFVQKSFFFAVFIKSIYQRTSRSANGSQKTEPLR